MIEIEKLSIQELKAMAYDLINNLEKTQRQLNVVNKRIEELSVTSNPA